MRSASALVGRSSVLAVPLAMRQNSAELRPNIGRGVRKGASQTRFCVLAATNNDILRVYPLCGATLPS